MGTSTQKVVAFFLVCLSITPRVSFADDRPATPQLWLYCPTNLLVDKNVDDLQTLWTRTAAAGYDHVLLADSKLSKLGDLEDNTKHYFQNLERTKLIASELHLQIIPALFDVGYSNNLLWHDPNLAEGLPVKDQPFIVHEGHATPSTAFKLPEDPSYKDDIVDIDGDTATVENPPGNARVQFALKTEPFRCYHVSVWIKTDHLTAEPEIKAIGKKNDRELQYQKLSVKRTQDWAEYHVVFNSLDSDQVSLYFGIWGGAKGTLRWKGWKIEECGLVNVLRRPGTPVTVKTDDGKLLVEGKDYNPIIDPNLGNHPWKGEYDAWHTPVTIKTALPEGTRLKVSWYHPAIIYDGQVSACIEEPKFNDLLKDEANRVKSAFGATGYMMEHDEFRTLGWDESCVGTHETPGQMLAKNVRFCTDLLGDSDVYVWSDMFDPTHNAVAGPYYLVNGPWTGSWEGLSKRVVVVNWNFDHRDQSLKFFAERGNRQLVAGYYDGSLDDTKKWAVSAKNTPGMIGFMYTTWEQNYSEIEAFAKICRTQ